jgi:hypothetical protein
MINAEKVGEIKGLILAFIQARGPSLPVHIARDVKIEPLFASAFLSELFREHKLRMSHLKVGSTALYLLPGQEQQLEQFTQYLNQREQEAYHLIKQKGLIAHTQLNPIMQVAITHISDFALSFDQQGTKYWHYAFLPQEELNNRLNQLTKPSVEEKTEPLPLPSSSLADIKQAIVEQESALQAIKASSEKQTKQKQHKQPKQKQQTNIPSTLSFSQNPQIIQEKEPLPFTQAIKSYIQQQNYTNIQVLAEEKKTCTLQATKEAMTFTFLAKERKKLQEADLQEAIALLQTNRTPIILILQALLDKKGTQLLEPWKNLIQVYSLA